MKDLTQMPLSELVILKKLVQDKLKPMEMVRDSYRGKDLDTYNMYDRLYKISPLHDRLKAVELVIEQFLV